MTFYFDCRFKLLAGLLIAVRLMPAFESKIALQENQGFCAGGSYIHATLTSWGSFCDNADATVGRAVTQSFKLSGPFEIYLSGYPMNPGMKLQLENASTHETLEMRPPGNPGDGWAKYEFGLPPSWLDKDVRIVAEDRSTEGHGWLAFGLPKVLTAAEFRTRAFRMAVKCLEFALLIFLPGLALSAFAASRSVRGVLKLGLITMAGMAIPGYLLFWVYLRSPKAGYGISVVLPVLWAAVLTYSLIRLDSRQRRLIFRLLTPLALSAFASVAVLSLGYEVGGFADPIDAATTRFSHQLPPDNVIPFLFAEGVRNGSVPKPLLIDWHSSDRPPLQTGMILALEPFVEAKPRLFYEIASVVMQSLWILPVWLLLQAFRCSAITTATVIATCYLSGISILNTFYVWPKLLAAAYVIACAIPLLAGRPQAAHKSWLLRMLIAFLLACGLMAHGGTMFALLGLLLYMLLRYRKKLVKETCLIGAITLLLYLPWLGYQKFIDPPGDHLIKTHLAGIYPVTSEGAFSAIYRAYRQITFSQWLSVKHENALALFGHEKEFLVQIPYVLSVNGKGTIRALQFFYFLPTLGIVLIGTLGLLPWKRRKANEVRAANRTWLWALCTTIPYLLLMFNPGGTVLHQGTYAMVLMALTGSILAFRSVAPLLATAVCAIQCIFTWIVYQPDLHSLDHAGALPAPLNSWKLLVHLIALVVFFAALVTPVYTARRNR